MGEVHHIRNGQLREDAARVAFGHAEADDLPLHKKHRGELIQGFLVGAGFGLALAALLWWAA